MTEFETELSRLINKYSMENESNTPDDVLARHLSSCLSAFNETMQWRERLSRQEPNDGQST